MGLYEHWKLNTNALSLVSLSITPTPSPLSLHSPSTSLYIPLSVRQDSSGIWGTLSGPQHSPPLGLRENLLHSQVKGTPCGKQRLLQRLKEETDWQKSEGCSISLHSPLQLLFYHFFSPPLACQSLTCMWMRKRGRRGLRATDKAAIWTVH